MPSIDELRRKLRQRVAAPVELPNPSHRWMYQWVDDRIDDRQFGTDVEARAVRTAIVGATFMGATLLAGEHASISGCSFMAAFTVDGDNMNVINCRFEGPVRYKGIGILFQGCHFKDGSPEPLEEGPTYAGNGNVIDTVVTAPVDLWQEFEISLHTAHPGIDAARGAHEATFGAYKRIRVPLKRDKPNWVNDAELSFAQCTGRQQVITHLVARALGFDSDDDERIIELADPVSISVGQQFIITPGSLVVTS